MDLTPEIDLAKALAGQRGGALIQYVQDFHRRRARRSQQFVSAVVEGTGLDGEQVLDLLTSNEELAALFETANHASQRTADENKIRLLARVVEQATMDTSRMDEAQLKLSTFRELDGQHTRALAVLAERR